MFKARLNNTYTMKQLKDDLFQVAGDIMQQILNRNAVPSLRYLHLGGPRA